MLDLLITWALCLIGVFMIITVHVCIRRRYSQENYSGNQDVTVTVPEDHHERDRKRKSLSSGDFGKLPRFPYKAEGQSGSNADCAVCLESFKIGEECRLLPICNHSFHVSCIDSWLLKTPTCPVCRTFPIPG